MAWSPPKTLAATSVPQARHSTACGHLCRRLPPCRPPRTCARTTCPGALASRNCAIAISPLTVSGIVGLLFLPALSVHLFRHVHHVHAHVHMIPHLGERLPCLAEGISHAGGVVRLLRFVYHLRRLVNGLRRLLTGLRVPSWSGGGDGRDPQEARGSNQDSSILLANSKSSNFPPAK